MREQTDSHSHHDQAHLRPHIISAIHQPHLESSPASLPRDTNTPPARHNSDANGNGNANVDGGSGSGTTGESINPPSQEVGYGEKQLSGASSPCSMKNHVQVPIQRQPTPQSHLLLSSPSSRPSRNCLAPSTRVSASPRSQKPSTSTPCSTTPFHAPTDLDLDADADFDAYSDFDPDAGEDVPTDVDTDIDTDPEPEPEIVVPEPVRELTSAEREALLISCGIIVRDYAYAPRPVG